MSDSQKPNREQIMELARTNPIVYAALRKYHRREITIEEAMILMVTTLAKQNGEFLDSMMKQHALCSCNVNKLLTK